jgi:hypothetical protein
MRRNIAPAGMLLWPIIAFAAATVLDAVRRRRRGEDGRPLWPGTALAAQSLIAVVAAGLVVSVVTNHFYTSERREWRFAGGLSRLSLPVEPAEWLDAHVARPQAVFADYNISSGVLYFTRMAESVPLVTNTWAYPPGRMERVLMLSAGKLPPDPTLRDWGMDLVVTQFYPQQEPFIRGMMDSPDWALVHVQTWYLVFARRTPDNAALIAGNEVRESTLDLDRYVAACRQADPVPAFGLKIGAGTLQSLGWYYKAEQVWRQCLAEWPSLHEGWLNLGVCLAEQGRQRLQQGNGQALEQFRQARQCFQRALELDGGYEPARRNLQEAEETIRRIEHIQRIEHAAGNG